MIGARSILDRFASTFRRLADFERPPTPDIEIQRVRASLQRQVTAIEALEATVDRERDCCAFCALGGRYENALEKAERTAEWLAILLTKRNGPGDAAEARRYRVDWGIKCNT